MGNQINIGDDTEVLFLTDQHGKSYIVSSETVEHASVPDELKTELHELVTADTKGYGNADWMLGGIVKFWGWSSASKGWTENNVGNFDLNGNGKIDAGDYAIAKKAWYEQHPQPPVQHVPPGSSANTTT